MTRLHFAVLLNVHDGMRFSGEVVSNLDYGPYFVVLKLC